ncbi:endonuclease NucS [bacterium]|nr:endonuclease NucS [bacterium]
MIKVKPIDVREREELEPLIVSNTDVIEQGLQIIAHQHPTDSGPLDILAVDSEGTLVIIELKNEASEAHLDQGLRYYDWCRQNISWISQIYTIKNINPDASPRLMLIAPSFTDTVRRIAKYVDIELHLIEYHAFQNEKGEKGLICTEIDIGQPPEPPDIPTIEKKMEYFQDVKVKELFGAVIDELRQKQIEIKPIHELWITCWYKGKRFMSMAPKRNFFVIDVLTPGGNWTGRQRVSSKKEWEIVFQEHIFKYIQYLETKEQNSL